MPTRPPWRAAVKLSSVQVFAVGDPVAVGGVAVCVRRATVAVYASKIACIAFCCVGSVSVPLKQKRPEKSVKTDCKGIPKKSIRKAARRGRLCGHSNFAHPAQIICAAGKCSAFMTISAV